MRHRLKISGAQMAQPGAFGFARDRLADLGATGRALDRGGRMTAATEQVSRLLHEAGGTCHRVFRIAGGAGEDWASWYSGWLVSLSWLPWVLGTKPVRSELACVLVRPAKDCAASRPGEPRETYYAQRLFDHFRFPGPWTGRAGTARDPCRGCTLIAA